MEGNRYFMGKNKFAKTRYNCSWTTLKRWINSYPSCYDDLLNLDFDIDAKDKKLPPNVQDVIIRYFG